ncbi:MAG: tRNA pseudouridine(38-40) synthase TruA [Deltaproteobacteria bacterium]|nr:tRNA pseudouridine(38-40) synthase TruA [Deltaproteobacteria bacterium]
MPKFKTVVEYDGTNYHGWQLQPNVSTIQGEIEKALEKIFHTRIVVYGAGRTDAGVHASGQVAHLIAPWNHSTENLKRAFNALLPEDISIRDVCLAPDDFHARHSAVSKTYQYQILNQDIRSPLRRLYNWEVSQPLDLSKLQEASDLLVGAHDFATFGTPTSGTPSTVREIFEAVWGKTDGGATLIFTIRGSGFLRFMVRGLVGTLVRVGSGKITVPDFGKILESRDRSKSGPAAPPQGLSLISVEYVA